MGVYGDKNWSDVINDVGDRFSSTLDSVTARRDAQDARDRQEQEQNRLLHPSTQKYLAELMNGNMTPAEAAAAAHDEIDRGNDPRAVTEAPMLSAPAPVGGSYGKLTDEDQGNALPNSTQNQVNLSELRGPQARPQAPSPRPPPPQFTKRDLGDAIALAPLQQAARPRAGLTLAEQMLLDDRKTTNDVKVEGVKGDINTKRDETKAGRISDIVRMKMEGQQVSQAAELKFKYWQELQRNERAMEELRSLTERARAGRASNEDIQRARTIMMGVVASQNQLGKVLGGDYGLMNGAETDEVLQSSKARIDQGLKDAEGWLGKAPEAGAPGKRTQAPATSSSSTRTTVQTSGSQRGDPQSAAALSWARANPNDPRAAAILKKLGVR